MAGFIEGIARGQSTLFPERLDDWVGEDHLVRVVDVFVEQLSRTLLPAVFPSDQESLRGRDGRRYTRAMALTLVPMHGVALYRTILTATERAPGVPQVTLAMVPLNAAANYVLVLGVGPVPALGPAGAGFGSLFVATLKRQHPSAASKPPSPASTGWPPRPPAPRICSTVSTSASEALRGELVPQDPADALLARIRAARDENARPRRRGRVGAAG